MMRRIATVMALATAGFVALAVGPAGAQTDGTLSGGGTLSNRTVELPQGASLPNLYSVYVVNRTAEPVDMEFTSSAPPGVTVTPDRERFAAVIGAMERVPFAVKVDKGVAPGSYPISVGLARSTPQAAGKITFVPAFASNFTLKVVGAQGTIEVRARDLMTGAPAVGGLAIARVNGDQKLDIARTEAATLQAVVAPGDYEARFEVGGRVLATKRLTVGKDEAAAVDLDVSTVTFGAVSLQRNERDDELQTVEISALLDNSLENIPKATTKLVVERDGTEIDQIEVKSYDPFPVGTHDVNVRYSPANGWDDGEYRFTLVLAGENFLLRAVDRPTTRVGVAPVTASDRGSAATSSGVPWWWFAIAAVVIAGVIVGVVVARRRRSTPTPVGSTAPRWSGSAAPAPPAARKAHGSRRRSRARRTPTSRPGV